VHRKPVFFLAVVFLGIALATGCHSGPSYQTSGDADYRALEREGDRNSTGLAVTGAHIAADVERIDERAVRIRIELDSLETVIESMDLAASEKDALLSQVAVVRIEDTALAGEITGLRNDTERLNEQLKEQREINAALSAEHDRREAAGGEIKEELAATREKLAKVSGRRNLYLAIMIALALAIIGYIVIRVLRFLKIIPL
jgi:chromosome segregation ATPase